MTVATEAKIDFSAARRAMIDSQLRVSGVNAEWVLAAMDRVPREDHVPAQARAHAYIDRAIPLDDGHALPAPLVHGQLLSEAAPRPGDKALWSAAAAPISKRCCARWSPRSTWSAPLLPPPRPRAWASTA